MLQLYIVSMFSTVQHEVVRLLARVALEPRPQYIVVYSMAGDTYYERVRG